MIGRLALYAGGVAGLIAIGCIAALWFALQSVEAHNATLTSERDKAKAETAALVIERDGAARQVEAITTTLDETMARMEVAVTQRDEARAAAAAWADGLKGRIDDTVASDGDCRLGPARRGLWHDALKGP
jgi:hypothetical protein